ncbi:DUF535 family protein [Phenylobacterium sp.]|uniref:DUF535 family protein n=1 Tax=Phenylobacterium sp. TaxID=1871053 RepID=UPI002E342E81|nr:DUF535 family protein [Phenylobacterium sp.]HEX3367099.1 DUF535 family protein [Phenylobacterium sp.]
MRKIFTSRVAKLRKLSREESLLSFLINHVRVVLRFSSRKYDIYRNNIPKISTRYTREYLSTELSVVEKRDIFLFHHLLLIKRFNPSSMNMMARSNLNIWNIEVNRNKYSIVMSMDKSKCGEGDVVLEFIENKTCLFDLSFTFAPGCVVGSEDASVVLITRLQGRPNRFDAIRRATKACGDIFPGHVLLGAAEGVAGTVDITRVCGVGTHQQLSSRWGNGRFNYDGFWEELFEERCGAWYTAAVPIPRKPLSEVSKAHRRRTKRKRLFKDAVANEVGRSLAPHLR